MWDSAGGFGFDEPQGGFMKQGGFDSPSTGGREKKDRTQNLVPLAIADLTKCHQPDDTFKLGSMDIHLVTIVGLVKSVDFQQTMTTYVVDDMSGPPLEAKYANQKDDGGNNWDEKPIVENSYVRLFGMVRFLQNKLTMTVFKIRPVTDLAEITSHLLEVVQARVGVDYMQKFQGGGMKAEPAFDSFTSGGKRPFAEAFGVNGLNAQQTMVYNAIRSCSDDAGCSLDSLYKSVKGLNQDQIRACTSFLNDEGHIYTTISDQHFKSTDS